MLTGVDVELDTLVRREHPVLIGALGLYLGDADEAQDIAQEALVRLVQRWPLEGVDSPAAWLMRVAFNLATSSHRRRARYQRVVAKLGVGATGHVDPTDAIAVRRAVARLPERQRKAIVLRYFVDLSIRETAEQLECPENTVKTLVHQAVAALRRAGLEVEADD